MATISKDEFLSCLRASKVIVEDHLQEELNKLGGAPTPQEIAAAFVKEDLLTPWQAKSLLSGRRKLRIGNYRLLDRIRHDEFGDRFFAVHEQLHRSVEIQLFPPNLNRDQQLTDLFLELAGQAATIDHPNLTHVYDIDRDGDRFYLVVEHVLGDTLDSFSTNQLSPADVARIVDQVLQGLEAAHQKNVIHGDIKPENLLLTAQDQIVILNLAIASLVNQELIKSSPIIDLQAIGKLGGRLLTATDSSNMQSSQELAMILKEIGNTDSTDLEKQKSALGQWIKNNDETTQHTVISGAPALDSQLSPRGASTSGGRIQPRASAHDQAQDPFTQPFVERNSVAILATTAAFCLLALGGSAWLAWGPGNAKLAAKTTKTKNSPVSVQTSKTGADTSPINKRGASNYDSKVSPIKNDREFESQLNRKRAFDMQAALQDSHTRLSSGTIGAGPVSIGSNKNPSPAQSVVPAATRVQPEAAAKTPVPSPELKPKPVEVKTSPPDSNVKPEIAPDSVKPDGESPVVKRVELSAEQLAAPFMDMPRAADLGIITETKATQLGKVYVPSNILMACELITGLEISKTKCLFDLEKSPAEEQRWHVNFRKRKSSTAKRIGSFFKQDDNFCFQWEPNASENESFNYIRNCVLKLTAQDDASQFVTLRTALPIEGLFINAEQGMSRIESDVKWMPNPKNLVIEVDLPSYQGLPKMYPFPATRQLGKNQPVSLLFSDSPKKNYIYLQLSADVRKKLRLRLALLFDMGNGKTEPVNEKILKEIVSELSSMADEATILSENANNAQRPPELKAAEFDSLKKQLKAEATDARTRKTAAIEYQNFIPKLYDKQIPLRVYFKLGNHDIILAESKEN